MQATSVAGDSGALDIGGVDARVMRVVDIKTRLGRDGKNRWQNLPLLKPHDEIKMCCATRMIICGQTDSGSIHLSEICEVVFSPAHGTLSATQLAEWILRDHLPVRMQLAAA